jgi:hypothetical protein
MVAHGIEVQGESLSLGFRNLLVAKSLSLFLCLFAAKMVCCFVLVYESASGLKFGIIQPLMGANRR